MKKKPLAKISCWAKVVGISEACRMLKKKSPMDAGLSLHRLFLAMRSSLIFFFRKK